MNKLKLFSLVGLMAIAGLTLTNCGGGEGTSPSPEITLSTADGFVSGDISLAADKDFKIGIEVSHKSSLSSITISRALGSGASTSIDGCGICDSTLSESNFSGTFNGTTGSDAGKETYTITVTDGANNTGTMTVVITNLGPLASDLVTFDKDNSQNPFRVYNASGGQSSAHQIGVGELTANDAGDFKDIQDSVNIDDGTTWPARWGSRNGSLFKTVTGYSWSNFDSDAQLGPAWDASGEASETIDVANDGLYIINIKNSGKYALLNVTNVNETAADNQDYTQFRYKYKP
jgi:hypothetical protein